MSPTKKSFISEHKDTFQIVYGTIMVAALYFGLSTKIELLVQKESSDFTMLQYQIDEIKRGKNANDSKAYSNEKYAVMPKETEIKDN